MKKIFFFLLVLALPSLSSALPSSSLKISLDMARFRGDSTSVYLEVYYGFDVSQLKYLADANGYRGDAIVSVMFKHSQTDSIVARQAMRIPFSIGDTTLLNQSRTYSDVLGFFLKPDIYRVYVVLKDANRPDQKDSASFPIDLKMIDQSRMALSDPELCTSIVPMDRDTTNRFYKNTMEVKPNPSKLFGAHQPVLFYYLETYNLLKNKSAQYYTRATVSNALGKEVLSTAKMRPRAYDSNVEVGRMMINALRTGAYTFTYTVMDSADHRTSVSQKKFFVYNPSLPPDTLVSASPEDVMSSEYATMTEEELDKEFDQAKYIASKQEIEHYKSLKGTDAKRKALFDFWNQRDDDKNTPGNEVKQTHMARIAYANAQYRMGKKDGWKTDRGRVYIVYGAPDEIERHVNEIDVKPYEVWYYHSIQGGVEFIFGDRTGFSDYILLHSTHRNELHDDNWQRQISAQ
ncbi:MAG TPA: GWxTD domain-containing protein [Bacteroidota bacterium]|nr:GWxTD domain-containing protein [Bacteroidota bacterium]